MRKSHTSSECRDNTTRIDDEEEYKASSGTHGIVVNDSARMGSDKARGGLFFSL